MMVHAKAELLVVFSTFILAKVLVALDAVVHASSLATIASLAKLVFRPLIGLSLLVPLMIPFTLAHRLGSEQCKLTRSLQLKRQWKTLDS